MKPLKSILFFTAFILCIKSYSQENKSFFGFKGGANYTTNSFGDDTQKINNKLGICAGLNFGYKVHKNILLLIEANYDQKGCVIPTDFTDNAGNPLGEGDVTYAFNYASVPLSVNYCPGDKDVFEIGVGFENGFLLAAHYQVPGLMLGGMSYDNVDIKDFFKSYEPGVFIRATTTISFTSKLGLLIEGRYSHGMANINNNESLKIMNSGFFLGTGLRFVLAQKAE